MIEKSAFTDINQYQLILTDIYLNYEECRLISFNIGLYCLYRSISVNIGLLNFLP